MTHHVGATDSCWLFVSSSSEARHLSDIVFGAAILRQRGVPADRIHIFTDHPDRVAFLHGLTNVHELDQLAVVAATLSAAKSCVIVVTGHGVHDGIGQSSLVLAPSTVLAAARNVPGVEFGVIVLGQCFAGVFNHLEAKGGCPLALIGGTGFNTSLSSSVRETSIPAALGGVLPTWSANLFLYYFFRWLETPNDVDGDGHITLVDGYKFAGTRSSEHAIQGKSRSFVKASVKANELPQLVQEFEAAVLHLQTVGAGTSAQPLLTHAQQAVQDALLRLRSVERVIEAELGIVYSLQDAWVLNANFARAITFFSY